MLRKSVCGRVLFAIALAAIPALGRATTISFEGLADGTVITDQFPGVKFSSIPGQEMQVSTQPGMGFGDNFICTADIGGSINCLHDVRVDFTTAVDALSFFAVGANGTGAIAAVDVYHQGELAGSVDIIGNGQPMTPVLVDLSGFKDVTSILIHSVTDSAGLGYDLFSFQPVPEPAGALLGTLGLIAMWSVFSKRAAR